MGNGIKTTADLIRELQEIDPSGELPVCVGNAEIFYLDIIPTYHDGNLQRLVLDPDCKCYNVIGAKYPDGDMKINIRPLSIEDALLNDPDMPIDYSELYKCYTYPESVERIIKRDEEGREECREIKSWAKSEATRVKALRNAPAAAEGGR
jgi:hypothetical protein